MINLIFLLISDISYKDFFKSTYSLIDQNLVFLNSEMDNDDRNTWSSIHFNLVGEDDLDTETMVPGLLIIVSVY